MRVRFTAPWDKVTARRRNGTPRAMQAFKALQEVTIPTPWAEEAIAAGVAEEIDPPTRDEAPKLKKVRLRG